MSTQSSHPDPGVARALPGGRCPRCGGVGEPPRVRRANPFFNPFLSKRRSGELVCQDCGLDFIQEEATDSRPPWGE